MFRSRGVNAAWRERVSAPSAASHFANVSLLFRAGGCDTIDLHERIEAKAILRLEATPNSLGYSNVRFAKSRVVPLILRERSPGR